MMSLRKQQKNISSSCCEIEMVIIYSISIAFWLRLLARTFKSVAAQFSNKKKLVPFACSGFLPVGISSDTISKTQIMSQTKNRNKI